MAAQYERIEIQVSIHPIDVIQHKRDGLTLSDAEIHVTKDAARLSDRFTIYKINYMPFPL